MSNEKQPINIQTEIEAIQANYAAKSLQQLVCALLIGDTGSGKTRFLETCRRPIHIDSFDKKGTSTVRRGIEEGWILADTRYEDEDPKNPFAFELWDENYERRRDGGYFANMGTYALDGLTLFSEAIMNIVLKGCVRKADRDRTHTTKDGKKVSVVDTDYLRIPQENDWPIQMNIVKNVLMDIITLPCDVVVIGHTENKTDKSGAVVQRGLFITGKLFTRIPRWFEEIYVMRKEENSSGGNYFLHTSGKVDGVSARTRLGRDKFADKEKPDMMALLNKAGLNPKHKEMAWMKK